MDRIRAALFDHRRALAAACAALAVLAGVQATRPADPGSPVLVAARDLASGHVVTEADLRTVRLAAAARPTHLLQRGAAVGRRVAGPLRAGEPITDRQVIEPRDLSGHGADAVLSTVRLDDQASTVGLRVGDRVDVVASPDAETPAQVVAADATVALIAEPADERSALAVGVVTTRTAALALATAGLDARLALLVRP